MKELIKTVNDLQNLSSRIGQKIGWQLPQIVVVGGQSAGKSSVLESFVGRDFLPRGSGIVTRRPLILQLQHANIEQPYAIFEHTGEKVFSDFDAVRQEIEDDTDRVTGKDRGLSRNPITLRVYSPDVLDLTLVDLPGLTKVHVGDQPENIEKLIEEMILEYITEDNSIILAVTPANSDLANSDALKLARKVDPGGLRTIGVITKLDLMDRGTNAREIFLGKSIPLKRGYVGVVNRAQEDIDNRMGIRESVNQENEWFQKSPYEDLMDRMGSRVLQEILNEQLGRHIKEKLPSINTDLNRTLKATDNELRKNGYFDQKDENLTKSKHFKILAAKFAKDVEDKLQGKSLDVSGVEVSGGTAIGHMFYDEIDKEVNKAVRDYDEKKMLIISANLSGYRHQNRLYPDDLAMERAIRDLPCPLY
jgi:dynamin GTPase